MPRRWNGTSPVCSPSCTLWSMLDLNQLPSGSLAKSLRTHHHTVTTNCSYPQFNFQYYDSILLSTVTPTCHRFKCGISVFVIRFIVWFLFCFFGERESTSDYQVFMVHCSRCCHGTQKMKHWIKLKHDFNWFLVTIIQCWWKSSDSLPQKSEIIKTKGHIMGDFACSEPW